MTRGLDYSWGRPAPTAIVAAGFRFVVRYLDYPGAGGKQITRPELEALRAAGLDVGFVYESWASRALDGRSAGVADAQASVSALRALGAPTNVAIYFAVDFDATEGQMPRVRDYLLGAREVVGRWVGVYGSYRVVEACHNVAAYRWQTYAWSGNQLSTKAQLYQYRNGQYLAGAEVDYNKALQEDWGQWRADMSDDQVRALILEFMLSPAGRDAVLAILRENGYRITTERLNEAQMARWSHVHVASGIPVPSLVEVSHD